MDNPKYPYVTLISSDGHSFIIPYEAACVAPTIRKMLDPRSNFSEAVTGRCRLEIVNGVVLEKICEYLMYNLRNQGEKDVPDMEIPKELCLELLMAADYLDV